MFGTTRIQITDSSQIAEARRGARTMAANIGFDVNRAEQVAIVATEISTNLVKHAGGGEILLTSWATDVGASGMNLLSLDRGPGVGNLARCLEDGFSTSGSAGQGLGAILRLSDATDFYCVSSKGCAILASWNAPISGSSRQETGMLDIGAINVCKPGQEVSGDSWGSFYAEGRTTILVADGLGHGPNAQIASREAVRMLHQYPDLPVCALLERAHQALRSSRGAAVAVARIDSTRGVVHYSGAGNISAQIRAGSGAVHQLVSGNGTVGHQMDKLNEFTYPWPEGALLMMYSDGLASSVGMGNHPGLSSHTSAVIAGVMYRDFKRGYDDATVVVAKSGLI